MTSIIRLDTADFPQFGGQESGRELELELTTVVTRTEMHAALLGGSPSEVVTLVIVRADITQTT